jgi:hypothetical protein
MIACRRSHKTLVVKAASLAGMSDVETQALIREIMKILFWTWVSLLEEEDIREVFGEPFIM